MTELLIRTVHRSVRNRLLAFRRHVEETTTNVGTGSRLSLVHHLFSYYVESTLAELDGVLCDDEIGDVNKLYSIRNLNKQTAQAITFFDERFRRGTEDVSRSLVSSMERTCEEFGADVEPILTLGPPGNFRTVVTDIRDVFFSPSARRDLPEYLRDFRPVFISIPQLEGTRPAWEPVIIGHELAHHFQHVRPIDYPFDLADLIRGDAPLGLGEDDAPDDPITRRLPTDQRVRQVAKAWLSEIACDAYAVHLYGPAAIASIVEFLESVSAISHDDCLTHPPGSLRALLMERWLDITPGSIADEICAPFQELACESAGPPWSRALSTMFSELAGEIWETVRRWAARQESGIAPYSADERGAIIAWICGLLEEGIPGSEVYTRPGEAPQDVIAADIINACWLAYTRSAATPVSRLTIKALDNLDFVLKWRRAGGHLADYRSGSEPTGCAEEGVLSEESIKARLNQQGPGRLTVTPQLPDSIRGVGLDVRLGNKFIIFHQSSAASFDPLGGRQDPRSMQYAIEKDWGEPFHLHPGQLVLAATLEYVALPMDLTAQVATRSSYGRLGLLSATAVQVHPGYYGCLTLELINLGEMPLNITPGERVAQLIFHRVDSPPERILDEKYQYPTGPEFSRLTMDDESEVLCDLRAAQDRKRSVPLLPPGTEPR